MKKVLFASVAAVALTAATGAMAAEPIKLGLGGYSKWLVGFADNDITGQEYQEIDVKGANEVFFQGSTTLDNGLKIGVDIQLEAGGVAQSYTAPIDEAYITVDGGFGRLIIGAENNGAYLLHVAAPNAAGDFEESEFGLLSGNWVVNPGGVTGVQTTTAINTDGDAEKITYVAPSFAGFTVGASYIPGIDNAGGHAPGQFLENQGGLTGAISDIVGVAAGYNNTFNGVGVKASVGYATNLDETAATAAQIEDHEEWSAGLQIGFAGFTVGGGYRNIDSELGAGGADSAVDGDSWSLGAMYATGPYAVSVGYFTSESDTTEDELTAFQVSGKYAMGPGVDLIGSVGRLEYDDAAGTDNEGWAAYTGLALGF